MNESRKPGSAKPLGDILTAVLTRYGLTATTAREELERAWRIAAGPELAAQTQVGSFRRGVLEILCADAILVGELESFRKREFLDAVKKGVTHSAVKEIRFKRK